MLRNCTTYIPRRNNRAVNEVLHEEKRWCGHLGDGKSRRGAPKVRRLQLRHELNTQQQTLTLYVSVSLPSHSIFLSMTLVTVSFGIFLDLSRCLSQYIFLFFFLSLFVYRILLQVTNLGEVYLYMLHV